MSGYYVVKLFFTCNAPLNGFCTLGIERNNLGIPTRYNMSGNVFLAKGQAAQSQYIVLEYDGYLSYGDALTCRCTDGDYNNATGCTSPPSGMASQGMSIA